jgi:hypothetical protein
MTEFEVLLRGLRMTVESGARHFRVEGDSDPMVTQVMETPSCQNPRMAVHRQEARELESKFGDFELAHVPRRENEITD